MTTSDQGILDTSAFSAAAARVAAGQRADIAAAELVASMTLDERLGCLDGDLPVWPGMIEMVTSYHTRPWPAAAVPRLGIPGIKFSDGPRGAVIGGATAYPVSMGRGATFDVDLEERIGEAIGAELRATGATFYGGVCINLLRHPAWGRAQETYGEDPHHVGEFGAALCRGVQRHVMACVKHFACNSIENARFKVDVHADDRSLHEVYLPHFRRVVAEGAAAVMSAYNMVNGDWCGESHHLLVEVLRDEWGFEGMTISDFVFGLRDPIASVRGGLDIEMPFRQQRVGTLPAALADGTLDESDIDVLARHVVGTQLRFASVFDPATDPGVELANAAHRALAREASAKACVVMRNDGVLPLDRSEGGRVAVLGRLADEVNLGDHGSSEVMAPDVVTILAGLRDALGHRVTHLADPSTLTTDDTAIVVVGRTYLEEGEYASGDATAGLVHLMCLPPEIDLKAMMASAPEPDPTEANVGTGFGTGGDRDDLGLDPTDIALIRSTAAAAGRTIVVLMGGSAIVTEGWDSEVHAIVHAWYPGIEGGHGVADVLTGAANASGRLPFAVPRRAVDLVHFDRDAEHIDYGLLHGQWHLDAQGIDAAYPFGWGLSYTTFELADVRVASDDGGDLTIDVTLTNTGDRDGDDVTFVFAGLPSSAHERPLRRLVGFVRTSVPAGQQRSVSVSVPLDRLAIRPAGQWVIEGGDYLLTIGRNAADTDALQATVTLAGLASTAGLGAR